MFKVLLVEDSEEFQLAVKRALLQPNIELTIVSTVEHALVSISTQSFDLAILDIGLPDGKGFEVLRELRTEKHAHVSVFLMTGQTDIESKLTAFNLGADDYLVKPVNPMELRARVEMRLKRQAPISTSQFKKGHLEIDIELTKVISDVDGTPKEIGLTAKEFKILALLAKNEGRIYSRTEIVKTLWGNSVHVLERTVDSHVFGMRKKLGLCAEYVENIPGQGYCFKVHDLQKRQAN